MGLPFAPIRGGRVKTGALFEQTAGILYGANPKRCDLHARPHTWYTTQRVRFDGQRALDGQRAATVAAGGTRQGEQQLDTVVSVWQSFGWARARDSTPPQGSSARGPGDALFFIALAFRIEAIPKP